MPIVATYHGVYSAKSGLKRWYNGVMTRVDLVIANSDYTRAHVLQEHGVDPARVVTIPRGVDLKTFAPEAVEPHRVADLRRAWRLEPQDGRSLVLLPGRLTRWKGQGVLIEALSRLPAALRQTVVLVMAGDAQGRDAYDAELRRQVANAGLQLQVQIVGHVSDMPAAYLAADIVAAPSVRPEAFGRTGVEPQAMQRPVLASRLGALTETVADGQTGWLVAPGDVDAWAAALAHALELPPEARARMGQAGRARVERLYSLAAMQASTLDVYRRLIAALR